MSKKKLKKKELQSKPIKKTKPIDLYFLLISTIIVIPLVYFSDSLDPNLAPRLLVLGIIIFGLAIINIVKPAKDRPYLQFVKLIIFPVFFLYLLWSVFSLTQAVNPAEGLYDITKTLLSIALLFFATQIFIKYKNSISILVKTVIVSSIIATSIGLYQYFSEVPGNLGYDLFLALYKIKGLMAHKNQFAISLFLMLPFTIYGVFSFNRWWWGISLYSTLLIFLNIVILQTRSVWIATLVFLIGFSLLWIVFSIKNKLGNSSGMLKKVAIIATIIVVVGAGSLTIFQKTGTLSLMKYKVSSIFDSKSQNNQGRLKIWESTWQLSQDNFLLGIGAGNWRIKVLPYYNVNFGKTYENWQRPHNDFLWVLSEKGIVGLLLYLMLFIIVAYYSIKIIFKETDRKKLIFTSLMISGIGGYLLLAFVTFPLERINHQIYIMIMMAVIISIYYKDTATTKQTKVSTSNLIYSFIILMSVVVIYYSGILIRSEVYAKKIYDAKSRNNWRLMILYADKAFTKFTTVDPFSSPLHLYKGVANMQLGNGNQALKDFQTAIGYFPTHISTLNNLGIISSEMNDSKKSISYFKQSLAIYPHYETSLFNMVNAYYRNKQYKEAYITLLNCNSKNKNPEYDNYKKVLGQLVNSSKK